MGGFYTHVVLIYLIATSYPATSYKLFMAIFKHPEQRVGVFIDTQNLYHSAKNIYHSRVNFGNVLKDSVEDRRLVRARAYMVTTETGEESAFLEALTKMGIEPKTKGPPDILRRR